MIQSRAETEEQKPIQLCDVLIEEYLALGLLEEPPPLAQGSSEERLHAIYKKIHGLERKPTGLCLSGGGIRSATFALGIIQGLAHAGFLTAFDYLSTVSGGGYTGSWITSWIHRAQGDVRLVQEELRLPRGDGLLAAECQQVNYLRKYSKYLSPKLGVFSADSWTLAGIYLRNLLLNWVVLLPLFIAVLLLPWILIAIARIQAPTAWLQDLFLGGGVILGAVSLGYLHLYRPSLGFVTDDHDTPGADSGKASSPRSRRESPANASASSQPLRVTFGSQPYFLAFSLLPLLIAAFLLTTTLAWRSTDTSVLRHVSFFGARPRLAFCLVTAGMHFLAWVTAVTAAWRVNSAIKKRSLPFWFAEAVVILASGAVGGAMTYEAALAILPWTTMPAYSLYHNCFGVPLFIILFLVAATVFIGIASRFTDDQDREWWGRSGAWALMASIFWSLGGSLVVFGPHILEVTQLQIPTVISMILSAFASGQLGFSPKTGAARKSDTKAAGWQGLMEEYGLRFAAPIFVFCLIVLLSLATSWIIYWLFPDTAHSGHVERILHPPGIMHLLALAGGLLCFAIVMSLFINVNKFSLHAMYRDRLIRAYLGASHANRKPNPFTGFDPGDNIQMHALGPQRPMHIVNIALNLVGGRELGWQQRKAQSFTVSPLHCGSWINGLGYRRTQSYSGRSPEHPGISIGTALAISGAAASPNMGYHSSPAVSFLLALFNVRLGWWLGNPGKEGSGKALFLGRFDRLVDRFPWALGPAFRRNCPRFAFRPIFEELFGLTDRNKPYVYLSDGGHFENLGLYELVRRRCHVVVVCDASADPESAFDDLGDAIRKIRVDQGVEIDLDLVPLLPQGEKRLSANHFVLGRIHYERIDPAAKTGMLLYIKPTLVADTPADVQQYGCREKDFPHEPTSDQFFSEAQFESYRRLGAHIATSVFCEHHAGEQQAIDINSIIAALSRCRR